MYKPGKDYTEHVANQTGRKVTEKPLFRSNGQWYKAQNFETKVGSENPLASLSEYVDNNFSQVVGLLEVRAFESEKGLTGFVKAIGPTPEYQVELEEIGGVEDLKSNLKEHDSEFPDGEGVGYLDLEGQFEELSDSITEDGDTTVSFLIEPVTEEDREAMEKAYSDDLDDFESIPEFDLQLASRNFVNHNGTIYEVK
jgi:hypothetical protein